MLFRLADPQGVRFNDEAVLSAYFAQAVEVQIDESGKNYRASLASPRAVFGDSHPGFFGLQFHTGKVQFRNIRIK